MKKLFSSVCGRVVVAGALLLLAAASTARAQAPAWQIAVALNGDNGHVNAMTTNAAGNVLVVGTFGGTLTVGATTLVSAGLRDGFVAKWSPTTGGFVWAQRFGNIAADGFDAVAVSGSNVYVTGTFTGNVSFGGAGLTSAGGTDAFVLKLVDGGSNAAVAWAQRVGGTSDDSGRALAVSGTTVYVGGSFSSAPMSLGTSGLSLSNVGGGNGWVARLTDAGVTSTFNWGLRLGGVGDDRVYALVLSGTALYVGGFFTLSMQILSTALTSVGSFDGFVVKLNDVGALPSVVWAQQVAGVTEDCVYALAVSGTAVVAAGTFTGTVGFGSVLVATNGLFDGFVAKYTDAGATASLAWAKGLGGPANDAVNAVLLNGSSAYVTGYFQGTAAFGPNTLTASGTADAFVARVADNTTSGAVVWGAAGGSSAFDDGRGIAIGTTRLYIAGSTTPPATFGSIALPIVTAGGQQSGFLAALAPTALATAPGAELAAVAPFPNPVAGGGTVRVPGAPAGTALVLLDALGRMVAKGTGAALPLAGVAPGLYALRVGDGRGAVTSRLVVE